MKIEVILTADQDGDDSRWAGQAVVMEHATVGAFRAEAYQAEGSQSCLSLRATGHPATWSEKQEAS